MSPLSGADRGRLVFEERLGQKRADIPQVEGSTPAGEGDPSPAVAEGTQPELHRGQLRFAERLVRGNADRLLHVHGIGWHRYDGARWAECRDGAETRVVVDLIKDAWRELLELPKAERDDLLQDIRRVESSAGVAGVLGLAGNLHPCTATHEEMDADPLLLNTRSGTVHLERAEVWPARPADRLSKVTRAAFVPEATSGVFEEFLARVQPDPAIRAYLARQVGSALLGRVREHVLNIWYGTGANGKGTLRDAVRHALGDYAIEVPPSVLLLNKYGDQALGPEKMRLRGARLAFCSEIARDASLDEATVKNLTGGDPVPAKLLYRNPIEFDPSHTLFMLTNWLPKVSADDPAIWRRLQPVPFNVVVPGAERDPELPEKLHAEADAVLAWLWAGWLDYRRQGLNPPETVLAAARQYHDDSDLIGRFLVDDSVIVRDHGSVLSSKLYSAFTDWCRTEGEHPDLTNKAFTTALHKRGFSIARRTSAGRWWAGLSLRGEQ